MAEPVIAFDADQYNAVINALTAVIDGFQAVTTSAKVPVAANVLLQPNGQTWDPAVELVNAGIQFSTFMHTSIVIDVLPRLTALRDGLIAAKSIFQDTEDLATISRADFINDFPTLAVSTPNRSDDPW